MKSLIRHIAVAAAALIAGAATVSPVAAQPAGNVVVFGDSFASNPDQYKNSALNVIGGSSLSSTSSTSSMRILNSYPSQDACLQAPNNWPRQLEARTGIAVADWSCTGQMSKQLPGHIDKAVRAGDLNRNTRAVTLAIGINDQWRPLIDNPGARYIADEIRAAYLHNMRVAAAKIRAAAPNAKIIIPGLLSITGGRDGAVCFFNVVPNLPLGVPAPTVGQWERRTQDNQRAAAQQIGATFLDIRAASAGHSTCARDADRWVAGLIDTTTADYNMVFHPSRAGSAFVADQVARAL